MGMKGDFGPSAEDKLSSPIFLFTPAINELWKCEADQSDRRRIKVSVVEILQQW